MTHPQLHQLIESAYIGGSGGEFSATKLLPLDQCLTNAELYDGGDSLISFLLQECVYAEYSEAPTDPEPLDMWEEARARLRTILAEVQAVHDAIHHYGPQPPEAET